MSDLQNDIIKKLKNNISKSIIGQEDVIDEALCCFLSSGHMLMTGAPGLAKTTLVRVFSELLGLAFSRVQFTPDLLPSDILGSELLNVDSQGKRSFEFNQGPIFTNLLLADEINRASPRTQSALLEAMQERRVTIASESYNLPAPFMVFATQNPFESEGTFALPEAQLDRFLVHTLVEYPNESEELNILKTHSKNKLVGECVGEETSKDKISLEDILYLQNECKNITIEDDLVQAISELVRSSRPEDLLSPVDVKKYLQYGAGPRAGISLISAAKSYALICDSSTVRWSHVVRMARPVLRHRLKLNISALREKKSSDDIISTLIVKLESKKLNLAKAE